MMKILAHKYLPEFSASLYIDNTVKLLAPPEALFDATEGAPLALCRHSFRTELHQEFHGVVEERLDDGARVAEQRAHYEAAAPELLTGPVLWAGLLLRQHESPQLRQAMELWCAHVLRYSRRDQLSATMALHMAGLAPRILDWNNYQSAYHSWPHFSERQESKRCVGAPETDAAKIAELEARLVSMWQGRLAAEAEVGTLLDRQLELEARLAALLSEQEVARSQKFWVRAGALLKPRRARSGETPGSESAASQRSVK
jgi:hypothetical protein